jgi:hypothetical protein
VGETRREGERKRTLAAGADEPERHRASRRLYPSAQPLKRAPNQRRANSVHHFSAQRLSLHVGTLLENRMGIVVAASLCVIIAVLPHHKGYDAALWFLGARFVSLLMVAFVAAAKTQPLCTEGDAEHTPRG